MSTASAPAVDPSDIITICEAEGLVKSSRQTLYRLVEKGELHFVPIRVRDSSDREMPRNGLLRSEMLSLFVEKPLPGEPIKLPDGTSHYLRDDAKLHFGFSDVVFYWWSKRRSRIRNKEPALRQRHFYIIRKRGRGRPKSEVGWNASDLQAIYDGEEGNRPDKGKGKWAREQRKLARDAATAFWREIKDTVCTKGIRASEGIELAERAGVSSFLLHATRPAWVDTVEGGRNGKAAVYWWVATGKKAPASLSLHTPSTAENRPPNGSAQAPTANGTNSSSAVGVHAEPGHTRGRRPSPKTEEVHRYCYENLGRFKRRTIMVNAQRLYGARAPKQLSHVTLFAKRYAKSHDLPFPPNR